MMMGGGLRVHSQATLAFPDCFDRTSFLCPALLADTQHHKHAAWRGLVVPPSQSEWRLPTASAPGRRASRFIRINGEGEQLAKQLA